MNRSRQGVSPFREWRKKQAYNVLPLISSTGTLLVKGLEKSMDKKFTGDLTVMEMVESNEPFVLAFLHGRLFLLIDALKHWPMVVMISISYMGEIQTRVLWDFGYDTIRGSRSRGGARALAMMTGVVRKGRIGAFAVDGPRGPYNVVKPGIVYVAKRLGVPVVPVTSMASNAVIVKSSWDRFLIPMPFSKAVVHFGTPMVLDGDLGEEAVQRDCDLIARCLEKLEMEANALVGRT